MEISYDPIKNYRNIQDRNLSFDQVVDFDFENAFYEVDKRIDYGELRMRVIGLLENRLHVLVFTETVDGIRVIKGIALQSALSLPGMNAEVSRAL